MGMFDNVNFEMDCPKCGTTLRDFQSKDGPCDLLLIDPICVNRMCNCCYKCKTWIELRRNDLPPPSKPRDKPYSLTEVRRMGFKLIPDEKTQAVGLKLISEVK